MPLTHKYLNTILVCVPLLALTVSSPAQAVYDSCTDLKVPSAAVEKFRKTGVPEQYGEDILHSDFMSDLNSLAGGGSNSVVRVLQTGADQGNILVELSTYFSNRNRKFYGLGINYPDNTSRVTNDRAKMLRQENIQIEEDDIADIHNTKWSYDLVGRTDIRNGTKRNLYFPSMANRFDIVIDCLSAVSNTDNITNTVDNSLDMLKEGGTYYITIPWKIFLRSSIPIANNWPDVNNQTNIHRIQSNDIEFINDRNHYYSGLRSNLDAIIRDDERIDAKNYANRSYGFSVAINHSDIDEWSAKNEYYLAAFLHWLTDIEGVDVYIQSSNQSDADFIDNDFGEHLSGNVTVNGNYQGWGARYGIENVGQPGDRIPDVDDYYDQDISFSFPYSEIPGNDFMVYMRTAIAEGINVSTDRLDQRYYELIPNERRDEVRQAMMSYAGRSIERLSAVKNYLVGVYTPSLAGSEFARKMYPYQKKYDSMLFIKLVKRTSGDISVPVLNPIWKSIGRPALRNFDAPSLRYEIDDDSSGDNSNDDTDDDITMQPRGPAPDPSNDREEKIDEDYDIVD